MKKNLFSAKCAGRVRMVGVCAASAALALALAGCASSGGTAQSINASDETNASGNTVGAYTQPESLTSSNADYEFTTPSATEISDIYTFTLEGKTYTLPCAASEFVDAGWTTAKDVTVAANHYASAPGNAMLTLGDDADTYIGLQLVNTTDAEASWDACTVVGITVEGNSAAAAEFTTKDGVKIGDTFEAVQKAYGASNYDTDRFGTIGYHFAVRSDERLDGTRWYGQSIDTLSFTADNLSVYPEWDADATVYIVRMENFGDIKASENE